jgi:hypothetical protein
VQAGTQRIKLIYVLKIAEEIGTSQDLCGGDEWIKRLADANSQLWLRSASFTPINYTVTYANLPESIIGKSGLRQVVLDRLGIKTRRPTATIPISTSICSRRRQKHSVKTLSLKWVRIPLMISTWKWRP